MAFEKEAEVMARCWSHMIKTGIITRFIQKAHSEKYISFPAVSQTQENILIEALKENFSKRINSHPEQFQRGAPGLNWDICSEDVAAGLKKADILIEDLDTIQFQIRPSIYMNSCGEVSVNNGTGCEFLHYPNPSLQLRFHGRHYLQLLDDVYTKYFSKNELQCSPNTSSLY